MSFPRYPAYKDSGVEWLGEVPVGWGVSPIKYFAKVGNGSTPDRENLTYWSNGHYPWLSSTVVNQPSVTSAEEFVTDVALRECHLPRVTPPAVLVGITGQGKTRGLATMLLIEATINQHIAFVSPDESRCLVAWVQYNFDANYNTLRVESEHVGSTKGAITCAQISSFSLPLPPIPEQLAIAAFLDRETAKIDTLVAEQQRLIALLKEKRQAVISHAVTKGLNPDAPMKPSDIEWLGEMPAHWTVSPLKWLTDPARPIMYGIVLPGPDVGEGGIPILKGGNVKPSRMNLSSMARTTPQLEAPYARARLRDGDLVYSIRGSIGDCEIVPLEIDGSNITQDVARVAVSVGVCASWVRWALLASAIRDDLACGSLGAAVRGINIFDLKRANIPTPPPIEQTEIAAFLDTETARLDALTATAERAIDLLQERRTALISAAVTGQIDVREVTA